MKTLTKAAAIYLLCCQNAYALLPKAPPTSTTAATNTDLLTYFKALFKDGLQFGGLAISGAGLAWMSWNLISDLNAVRTGRKEWGEVGMAAVAGVVVFGYVSYLLLQSSGVL